jgi:CheY-like chemotaxis protein
VCDLLAQRAHDKGLELVVVVDEPVPDALVGDAGRLRQILMNLIGNAVKFTENGEVSIRVGLLRSDGQSVGLRFEVRDTGIGIPPEALPRLFHAFVQADGSTTRRYGGTGLGLAISRQIVGLMGGTIEAESTVGVGSVFRFTACFTQRAGDQSRRAGRRVELQGKRTLVVDDNATNREVLARSLQSSGMAVTCASDGPSALRIALEAASRGTAYELAILDMMMPGMDGLQLARAIRGSPELPTMGLLLLTSVGGQGEPDEARRAGVDAYLTKPIRQTQLLDALVGMLRRTATRYPQAAPAPIVTGFAAPGARILVVDDNVVNRAVIVGMLEAYECITSEAEDGGEAVRKAGESDFDLVFMDCQMPVLDGFEATAEIRRQEGATSRRRVPIVALTASALKGERERCLAAGMDDYLSKPVRQEQLGETVRRWVPARPTAETNGAHAAPTHRNGKNGGPGNGVLDHSVIDSIRAMPSQRAGDTLSRLVNIYLQHTPNAIRQLRAAADGGHCGEAQRVAHTIKSSSAMLGATGLARLLADAEAAGRENAGDSLVCLVSAIEVEYTAVERALTHLLPSGTGA